MKYPLLILVLLSCSCSAPVKRFAVVPTTAVHSSIAETRTNIGSAKNTATKAKESNTKAGELAKDNQALKLQIESTGSLIDALTQDLMKADRAAATAESRLTEVDEKNKLLVDEANKVATENIKLKAFWDQGHKYWGIGGIIQGFGILAKNVIILVAFLVLLGLVIFALSFVFPFLLPLVSIVTGFFKKLWNMIFNR